MTKKKCKIYCRVSGKSQDILGQLESLPKFAKSQGWDIFGIYSDDGISGSSVYERPEFLKLLHEMNDGKFDILLVEAHDRVTRSEDLAERGLIMQTLKENNISLWSPTEGICDLTTSGGQIVAQIKFMQAAQERIDIRKRTLRGRVTRCKKGIPAVRLLPFARNYDRENHQWSLDEKKADIIRDAARCYIAGESLWTISEQIKSTYGIKIGDRQLLNILKSGCSNKWTITYKGQEPIAFDIPAILPDSVIEKIHIRIEQNRIFHRKNLPKKYVLSSFIRCGSCHRCLSGQYQNAKHIYYRHPWGRDIECKAPNHLRADKIEPAIFKTIFENVYDEPKFNETINKALPDADYIETLKESIAKIKKELVKVDKSLYNLSVAVEEGTMHAKNIAKREAELEREKDKLEFDLERKKDKLRSLPDVQDVKRDARRVRRGLMDYYGKDWMHDMTFEDKRKFLHWLFDGRDEYGSQFGIYINRKTKDVFDYEIHSRFFSGARFLKGDDYDYWDDSLKKDLDANLVQRFKDEPKTKRRKLKTTPLWDDGPIDPWIASRKPKYMDGETKYIVVLSNTDFIKIGWTKLKSGQFQHFMHKRQSHRDSHLSQRIIISITH